MGQASNPSSPIPGLVRSIITHPRACEMQRLGGPQNIVFSSKPTSPGPLESPRGIIVADLHLCLIPSVSYQLLCLTYTPGSLSPCPWSGSLLASRPLGLKSLRNVQQVLRVICWNPNPQLRPQWKSWPEAWQDICFQGPTVLCLFD